MGRALEDTQYSELTLLGTIEQSGHYTSCWSVWFSQRPKETSADGNTFKGVNINRAASHMGEINVVN